MLGCIIYSSCMIFMLLNKARIDKKFNKFFKKNWPYPASFCLYSSFQYTVDGKQMFNINLNIAYEWIRTEDLWYRKRPLYQLSHNHCPEIK